MKQLVDISKLDLNTVNEQIRNFAQISITGARCAPLQHCEKSNRVPVGARIARPRFVQNLLFAQLLLNRKIKKFSDSFICGKGYSPPSGENSFLSTVWMMKKGFSAETKNPVCPGAIAGFLSPRSRGRGGIRIALPSRSAPTRGYRDSGGSESDQSRPRRRRRPGACAAR